MKRKGDKNKNNLSDSSRWRGFWEIVAMEFSLREFFSARMMDGEMIERKQRSDFQSAIINLVEKGKSEL